VGRDQSAEGAAGTGREIGETGVGTEAATGERGGAQDLGREIGGRQRGQREGEGQVEGEGGTIEREDSDRQGEGRRGMVE
jgi:hypothetical protein